jgi:hypothetical protein
MTPVRGWRWSLELGSDSLRVIGGRVPMARRRIVQDTLVFSSEGAGRRSSFNKLLDLIDRTPVEQQLRDISFAAKEEPARPP